MSARARPKKEWNLTQEAFAKFLSWLNPDPDKAGEKYEEIRLRLIKIFASRGCACPEDSRSYSDFDIRHIVNGYMNWQFPMGRGKQLLNQIGPFADAILGGWQLSAIYRWNSGLPAPNIVDANVWATNWNVQSYGVRTRPIESSPTRGGAAAPNLFSDPVYAYQSFRNSRAGETGDRNPLRLPGFVTLDMGLGKSFNMPWHERHQLQFRWEVFNVTNTQRLKVSSDGYSRESFGIGQDPELGIPAPTFGNFDSIQGTPRVMQFALRYTW
jgi:hypothetical protein